MVQAPPPIRPAGFLTRLVLFHPFCMSVASVDADHPCLPGGGRFPLGLVTTNEVPSYVRFLSYLPRTVGFPGDV